ncbi:MAG: efflux RND transporter permease subunit [Candidatus Latescibacterota bacterium]|nr:MAG: efflux RND transporter permease subunit [Candidatus Latescibacterota bacterium]
MKIIHAAIRFPVTTAVGVILVVMFGTLAIFRIPVQLTPNVEEPEISVTTIWPGASPQEIEREIIDEQEEQLKSLEGLRKMESSSSDSRGNITLTFQVGSDLDAALLRTSNRLEQVPSYPPDAEKPIIRSVGANQGAIAWFVLYPAADGGLEGDIATQYDFADDVIKPAFERVSGVAACNIYGGREREMQVIVDPARLAARQVTLNELAAAIDRENRNFSGGDFDEGKRRYIVRTVGEYESPEDIEQIVVAVRNGVPVYLRDVATAQLGYHKPRAQVFMMGTQVLAINAIKEPNANVLDTMAELGVVAEDLNQHELAPRGLEMLQVYDETEYIKSSIALVKQSLLIGGILAITVLLLYLRSATSTLVIAVAIPISVIGAFLMMSWFGRTLNVISLAGMAFAVGMVVDNSIVVLENIYRHRQMGKSRAQAAHDAASEVWGAVLASTLTTIAVFVPIAFIQEEVGQLFGDIAIAISCAVGLSLLVSITVIPTLSAKILGGRRDGATRAGHRSLWGGTRLAGRLNDALTNSVYGITRSNFRRIAVILLLTTTSLVASWLLMPKTEYLPTGNTNFLFGFMLPPPGLNLEEVAAMHDVFKEELEHLWSETPGSPRAEELPGGGIKSQFFVALNAQAFMGARANDPLRVRELIPEFRRINGKIPGTIFVINQSSLFQRGIGQGRNIDIEITGPDLNQLIGLGGEVFAKVRQELPGAQARPIPSLDLGNPEVRVRTHRRRAAELGLSNRDLGFAVSALVDGAKASEFQYEGRALDLEIKAEQNGAHRTHLIEQFPISTPSGDLVTLGSVADIDVVTGPVTINHSERQRTITIQVTPERETPLEVAMETIEAKILDPIREQGRLGGLYSATLSGTADKLSQTWGSLRFNFLLAIVITYLLLAALFENFIYPFVIMFSVPLAAFGGILGLAVVNLFTFQALDTLTMLGFIILVGTVVNNAILIVHQTLNHMRNDGLASKEAIRESVRTRIRPIFMSVSTSVCGMLPLVLFPGAGSELYRGLGSVVVGGLLVSTFFTLLLVPAVLSVMLDVRFGAEAWLRRLLGLRPSAEQVG